MRLSECTDVFNKIFFYGIIRMNSEYFHHLRIQYSTYDTEHPIYDGTAGKKRTQKSQHKTTYSKHRCKHLHK